jgi:beta-glucosidase
VVGQGKPQFALGYGLTYADRAAVPRLSEVSGISGEQIPIGNYLDRGKAVHGYRFTLVDGQGASMTGDVSPATTPDGALHMAALDYKAQEDARLFSWNSDNAQLVIHARTPLDLDRETNGDVLLVTTLRVDAMPAQNAWVGMGCGAHCQGHVLLAKTLATLPPGQWTRVGVPLKCFRAAGADMHHIDQPFAWGAGKGTRLAISRVALGTDVDQVVDCVK